MNRFLEAVERRALEERETRILETRGAQLRKTSMEEGNSLEHRRMAEARRKKREYREFREKVERLMFRRPDLDKVIAEAMVRAGDDKEES